jgi:CRP/FNR family transcriptional regulator
MKRKTDLLAASLLFSGLPAEQLREIEAIALSKTLKKGESIFFEGDPGIGFFMVAAGKVKIFKMSMDGREQILHIFGPGEPFGEVPVFHGSPFPANAETLTDAELLFFPRADFVRLLSANPSLALNMLAVLALRLRRFATQIENLSLKEVPGRLAAHLLYLAGEQGSTRAVVLDIPKGQLASLLGTSSETLSRIFAKMSEEQLIRMDGKRIELLDIERLRER